MVDSVHPLRCIDSEAKLPNGKVHSSFVTIRGISADCHRIYRMVQLDTQQGFGRGQESIYQKNAVLSRCRRKRWHWTLAVRAPISQQICESWVGASRGADAWLDIENMLELTSLLQSSQQMSDAIIAEGKV